MKTIKGIGPKRAKYIAEYRREVGEIANTFDLAMATGLSLTASKAMASQIDWHSTSTSNIQSTLSLVTSTALTFTLIIIGFGQIVAEPLVPPWQYLHLALVAILLGGLAGSGDIAIAAVKRQPSETTWMFAVAATLLVSGVVCLLGLLASQLVFNYPTEFSISLKATLNFVIFSALILGLLYGPAAYLRIMVEDKKYTQLTRGVRFYDYGQFLIAFICLAILIGQNTPSYLEEIFSIWCITILSINGYDMVTNESPYIGMLSQLDRSRINFLYHRRLDQEFLAAKGRKLAGLIALLSTLPVAISVAMRLF